MFAARVRLLIATLWAGSLWTIGYIAAPTLFAVLPERTQAGTVAAALFRIEAWLSVVCALALFGLLYSAVNAMAPRERRTLLWIIAAMLLCTLVGYFGLQPFMAELRAAAGAEGVMEGALRSRFGQLHGIASVFYLVQSLLAIALIWKLR
jgi:hypothetical protein